MEITRRLLFIVGFGFILGSALGAPSPQRIPTEKDKLAEEVVDKMKDGMDIMKNVTEKAGLNTEKINKLVKKMKERMVLLQAQIGETNAKHIAHINNATKKFHEVTHLLRVTRNRLIRLSIKTVTATEELKLYMVGWGDQDPKTVKAYLKEQLQIMRELLEESEPILEDAEEKYNEAIGKIDEIDLELTSFEQRIQQVLNENSAEYKQWTTALRTKVYASAGGVTAGFAILDFLGCLGLCSAIGTTATWSTSVGAVETAIADYKATLKNVETTVKNSINSVTEMKSKLGDLSSFMQNEVRIIDAWAESVDNMKKKINSASDESFHLISVKRDIFTKAIIALQLSAQAYRDTASTNDSQGK